MFIFIFERKCEWGRGRKKGGQRIQSRLRTVSTELIQDLNPQTNCEILTWSEVRCLTDWATPAPQVLILVERDYTVLLPEELVCILLLGKEKYTAHSIFPFCPNWWATQQ